MTTLDSFSDVRLEVPASPWQGPVPVPDIDSAPFWEGLRQRRLLILRCEQCGYWVHPPLAGCPRCHAPGPAPQEARGLGTLYSFTVVNREFAPGVKPPYVAAFVDLVEQDGLRMLTNLVNVRVADVRMDMAVRVVFHDIGDMTLALFEPAEEAQS